MARLAARLRQEERSSGRPGAAANGQCTAKWHALAPLVANGGTRTPTASVGPRDWPSGVPVERAGILHMHSTRFIARRLEWDT
jgi:hypothetical protein